MSPTPRQPPPAQPRRTLRADAAALVEACPGVQARQAARRISQFLDRELVGTGLTGAQLGLMAHIATIADDTLGALARRAGLEQSTLSRNLRTLEREGLVEIVTAEADLRRRAVWLTEAGLRRMEAALPLWRRAQRRLAGRFSPALVARLAAAGQALAVEDPGD